MKAISIRQPWAWAILHAGKRIENRTRYWSHRGPVLLHASKGMTEREFEEAASFIWRLSQRAPTREELDRGGIVGRATIVGCVHESDKPWITERDKPWFFGPWGIVLDDVQPLPFHPCKGALGLFEASHPDVEEAAA